MMRSKATLLVLCVWGALLVGLVGIAQQSPTEAPAGFDTPALSPNPGSASISNGINQSKRRSCRARSRPLTESFAPPQLICSHGRKKQISTMITALRLTRRSI